jgi:3-oxoacyl-[acyl-carrier protein] reductase
MTSEHPLEGKFAVITGASQGLGAAIAEAYIDAGASVLLCARNAQTLERTADRLRSRKGPHQLVEATVCDVGETADIDKFAAFAETRFARVDILVNNAGVYGPFGPIDEVDWSDWVSALQINLIGTVYLTRAFLGRMRKQGSGKIIMLSGGGATNPLPRISAYAASKAGLVRFTECLAEDLRGTGIDVNALAPGALATRMMDDLISAGPEKVGDAFFARMKQIADGGGTPLSVGATCCVWLASAASNGITGKLIAAQWDPWRDLPAHMNEIEKSDIYTLRRIVPRDRGMNWGNDA